MLIPNSTEVGTPVPEIRVSEGCWLQVVGRNWVLQAEDAYAFPALHALRVYITWDCQVKPAQGTIIPSSSNCANDALERCENSLIFCKSCGRSWNRRETTLTWEGHWGMRMALGCTGAPVPKWWGGSMLGGARCQRQQGLSPSAARPSTRPGTAAKLLLRAQ